LQEKSEKENRKNFYDIQALSLIPGTVGAAIFGNIGAFGTEVKKYIKGVEYFDIEKKEVIFIADYRKFEFSYRNSFFKKNKNKYIILSVTFDFSEKYSEEVNNFYKDDEYFSLEHFAKKHNLGKIKKSEIRENIIKLRKNIYPDIEKFPNVGSTFKNAEVSQKEFEKIFKKYPEIPN
jgi:UDP-N-acetylmuramate dehydrogenase